MPSLPRVNSSGKRLPHVQLGCRGTAQPQSSGGGTRWSEKDLVRGQETGHRSVHEHVWCLASKTLFLAGIGDTEQGGTA